MDNREWLELCAQRRGLDQALAEKKILLSEWLTAVDPILHRISPSLDEAVHPFSVDDIREMEERATKAPTNPVPRVLVARRFRDARENAQSLLGPLGCEVTTAGDGLEALIELAFGRYDLLITGSVLPHLSGVELLEYRVLLGLQTPAIMHTLMPQAFASGLSPQIPLPPEDCICTRNLAAGPTEIDFKDVLDGERRLIARVKEHLSLREKGRFGQ